MSVAAPTVAPETLPILYRDERLVVVDKPSGLLVHRSPIDRHETRFALQLLRDQLGQRVYTIHRLDKGTSGVLAFGLDPATARDFATFELPVCVDRYPTSRYALVELSPHTGRRHQLRRHLAGASHPIVGDSTYGKGRHNRLFRERFGMQRLLLACTRLEFPALAPGAALRIEAPLAVEFAALLDRLGAEHAAHPLSPSSP